MKNIIDEKMTLYDVAMINKDIYHLMLSYHLIKDDIKMLEKLGKKITLESTFKLNNKNIDTFLDEANSLLANEQNQVDKSLQSTDLENSKYVIEGILPCPVRIPLEEALHKKLELLGPNTVGTNFKAASSGTDWILNKISKIDNASELSDIFISAGFDLFFDKKQMGRFNLEKNFKTKSILSKYNKDFSTLMDPKSTYHIIGVVPAVFLINKKTLGDRKTPLSWKDLLDPIYSNSISLPVGDFDLFNAILLNIHRLYGDEGILKLSNNFQKSLHPSTLGKDSSGIEPAVTIMPYFFTKMIGNTGPMFAIWPQDGAIISPIFMLTKKQSFDELEPIISFLSSVEVGKILSHNGRFPSTNPDIDNFLPENAKFMWLGFDYIHNNDIGNLINRTTKLFNHTKL